MCAISFVFISDCIFLKLRGQKTKQGERDPWHDDDKKQADLKFDDHPEITVTATSHQRYLSLREVGVNPH